MNLQKITPILTVQSIEPCLGFWEKLGFRREVEVPAESGLVFVILKQDHLEVMYQTFESLGDDLPAITEGAQARSVLYIEVADIDTIAALIDEDAIVVPRRTTDYGATEIWASEPGGNIVGFAQQAPGDDP